MLSTGYSLLDEQIRDVFFVPALAFGIVIVMWGTFDFVVGRGARPIYKGSVDSTHPGAEIAILQEGIRI